MRILLSFFILISGSFSLAGQVIQRSITTCSNAKANVVYSSILDTITLKGTEKISTVGTYSIVWGTPNVIATESGSSWSKSTYVTTLQITSSDQNPSEAFKEISGGDLSFKVMVLCEDFTASGRL